MCIEVSKEMDYSNNKKTSTYCIKKVLKAIFNHSSNKKIQKTIATTMTSTLLESLESLDNLRNSQFEEHYEEIEENAANEKLSCFYTDDQYPNDFQSNIKTDEEEEVFVPVRFARTDAGTFFWTTNLQPATIITRSNDMDSINEAYCYSNTQYPELQYQDRWAQA